MKNLKFFDVTVALFFVVVGMVSIFQFSVIAQTVDRSFLPTIEKRLEIPAIGSQAVQSDGKLIVSGGFAFVDGKIQIFWFDLIAMERLMKLFSRVVRRKWR
jgi:hypothetical protein